MTTFRDYSQLKVQMKVREFSLHKEKERQTEEENKKEKAEKEQAQQSEQSSSKGSAGETKIKSQNRFTKLIGNITQKLNNRKKRDETESYAQQPIEMNTFIRKRRLYFFPNMEKASYWIRKNSVGSCSIVDKGTNN